MPIYEFVCENCGNEFEKLQSFSDTTMPTCPKCQSVSVQRKLSSPAIHFKGSGWYINDSKSGNKNSANGKSTPESSDKGGAEKSENASSTESKTTESKNTESKSTESKPAESKAAPSKSTTTETA